MEMQDLTQELLQHFTANSIFDPHPLRTETIFIMMTMMLTVIMVKMLSQGNIVQSW